MRDPYEFVYGSFWHARYGDMKPTFIGKLVRWIRKQAAEERASDVED